MKSNNFKYKTFCELAITSDEISPELISKDLKVKPSRTFRKGDKTVSINSGSLVTKPYNLWALQSKSIKSSNESISVHINYFKKKFQKSFGILNVIKDDPRFEVSFWVWIETDNSGIGFDLNSEEIALICSISNRIHFSFLTKDEF